MATKTDITLPFSVYDGLMEASHDLDALWKAVDLVKGILETPTAGGPAPECRMVPDWQADAYLYLLDRVTTDMRDLAARLEALARRQEADTQPRSDAA